MEFLDEITSKKYVTVETYKRDGSAVKTPVWFFVAGDEILIVTRSKTGKAKRLRNNPKVRIAQCTIRGKVQGPWKSGHARILDRAETVKAVAARGKKYGIMARMAGALSSGKGEFFAFAVRLDL